MSYSVNQYVKTKNGLEGKVSKINDAFMICLLTANPGLSTAYTFNAYYKLDGTFITETEHEYDLI